MARTELNSSAIPAGTVVSSDLTFPLTNFSSTGIDDNASNTAITINANGSITIAQDILNYVTEAPSDSEQYARINGAWAQVAGGIEYTVSTSNVTATADQGIIADTSAGAFTITLPASPSAGDKVFIADGGDWSNNNLTVARNGSTIEDSNTDFTMDYGGVNVGFIYDGSTWQVYPQAGLLGLRGIDDNALSTAITIAANNNVGIGETSPSYLLDLKGGTNSSIRLNALSGSFIFANGSGLDKGSIAMSGGNMNISADAGINFYSAGSPLSGNPQVIIDTDGFLGIGTDPVNQFHLASSGSGYATMRLDAPENTTPATFLLRAHDGVFDIRDHNNGNTRLVINSGGNMLFGGANNAWQNDGRIIVGNERSVAGQTGLSITYNDSHTVCNFGGMYSTSDILLGYGVESSTSAGDTFVSTVNNVAWERGALTIGNDIVFRNSSAVSVAQGSPVTMTERFRFDSNGYLGIATNSPQRYLDINVGSASAPTNKGHIRLRVGGSGGGDGGIEWRGSSFGSGYGWKINCEDPGGQTPLIIYSRENNVNWTEIARFRGSAVGGGIAFNGDTAAANALDDYEEGTWTAHVRTSADGSIIINSTALSNYIKIGRQVTVFIRVYANSVAAHTFNGTPYIQLPFDPSNDSGTQGVYGSYYSVGMGTIVSGYAYDTTTFYLATSTASPFNNPATNFSLTSGNKRFYGTLTYMASS